MAQMPRVDVVIVKRDAKPSGVGEEAVGPVAPAVANAIFAATGKRVRSMPFSKDGFTLA
jgi:isoquinoline 1-oxidoreductase beta subunit